MMGRFKALREAAEEAEAHVAVQRARVKRASDRVIVESERLSDQIEPCRTLLRRAGVHTELPTKTTESAQKVIDMTTNIRPLRLHHGLMANVRRY